MAVRNSVFRQSSGLDGRQIDTNFDYLDLMIQTLNVQDYGATGDGVTDDILPIKAAVAAASAGDIILFPHGKTFLISTPIVWPSVDNVVFSGYGATVKLKGGTNADLLISSNYPSTGGGQNPRIVGLTIDGNSANNTGSGSMVFYGVDGGYMCDVVVQNFEGVGFFLRGCNRWSFENCRAIDGGASGFCAYADSHNVYWNNCHALRCAPGFLLQGPEVDGQLKSSALHILGGSTLDTTTSQSGIQVLQGVEDFSIVGMEIRGNAARGIDVYSGVTAQLIAANLKQNKHGVISANIISNNSVDEGIKIWDDGTAGKGALDIVITGNRIFDDQGAPTQAYGVVMQNQADNILVTGNDLTGNGTGPYVSGGSGTNIKAFGNLGYVTENSGKATGVATGGTIAHGLFTTPTSVSATAGSATPTNINVTVDATNITVNFGGGGNHTFFWMAQLR